MSADRPTRTVIRNIVTFAAAAGATLASVALVEHESQRPAEGAAVLVSAAAAAVAPAAPGMLRHDDKMSDLRASVADLELVGRSIANYDR